MEIRVSLAPSDGAHGTLDGQPAFSLKAGEMSQALVNSRQGWHLVKVVNVIEPSTKSFDEVKVDVARKVLVDERRDARRVLLHRRSLRRRRPTAECLH